MLVSGRRRHRRRRVDRRLGRRRVVDGDEDPAQAEHPGDRRHEARGGLGDEQRDLAGMARDGLGHAQARASAPEAVATMRGHHDHVGGVTGQEIHRRRHRIGPEHLDLVHGDPARPHPRTPRSPRASAARRSSVSRTLGKPVGPTPPSDPATWRMRSSPPVEQGDLERACAKATSLAGDLGVVGWRSRPGRGPRQDLHSIPPHRSHQASPWAATECNGSATAKTHGKRHTWRRIEHPPVAPRRPH